ncbi:MAG: homocysteine S-methyltransferase family protein [Clostridia bacterium]|nr:homocysteine S-methyltransferase family protein [Clostridia bacterium]
MSRYSQKADALRARITHGITYMDGGMGTQLQARGLGAGELPELWNLNRPEDVTAIHRAYFAAGAHVVTTNTFGANALKYTGKDGKPGVAEIVRAGVACAMAARDTADTEMPDRPHFVALDIGPTGRLIAPMGDLDFEEAVELFGEVARIGCESGADAIIIETMSDCAETRAAVLGAMENADLPVFVTNAYEQNGRLLTGTSPEGMAALLGGMGVSAMGLNCSFGPDRMLPVVRRLAKTSSLPLLVSPNAGLPVTDAATGRTYYSVTPEEFAAGMVDIVLAGATLVGGCCGTTPDHIRALVAATEQLVDKLPARPAPSRSVLTSRTRVLAVADDADVPLVVGECINPSGRPTLAQEIADGDTDEMLDLAMDQMDCGAQVLDINVAIGGEGESARMKAAVCAVQSMVDLPLAFDSSNAKALEAGLRAYHGRGIINSLTGKQSSLDAVLPLAKKYGGMVVGLTMDEQGIPSTAQGRVDIAARIVAAAEAAGLCREELLIDPLVLPEYTAEDATEVTLEAARRIRSELGVKVLLAVSNVSYGMRDRESINIEFLRRAMDGCVDAVMVNPLCDAVMELLEQ